MVRTKALRQQPANGLNHMHHPPRPQVRRALPTLREARLPRHLRRLHSGLLLGEHNLRSQPLLQLLLSCRSLQAATRHPATNARRQIIHPLLSREDTRRISAHPHHHLNKLHTILNTMPMLISDNNHRTLLNKEASTVTASHTLTRNLHRLRLSKLHLRQPSRTLGSSSSSSSQHRP